MRFAILAAVGAGCFASGALAQSYLLGPRGEFKTSFLSRLEYDPSRGCSKPFRPYSNDRFAMDQYLNSARSHVQCLEDAATADMTYVQSVVEKGYQDAVEEFLDEVERGY